MSLTFLASGIVDRYGVEATSRQFLLDVAGDANVRGVYLMESPRFRAIVAAVTGETAQTGASSWLVELVDAKTLADDRVCSSYGD